MMMMPPPTTFMGFIVCPDSGGLFCMIDLEQRRIDLVSTPETREALSMRVGVQQVQTVGGTLLSSPDAPRPRLLVTSVSGPVESPPPTMPPTPPLPTAPPMTTAIELPSSIRNYIDCVGRCLGEKVPGAA
ncbi:MAG TPA: hypothetical protein VD973_22050, partial [Symbiobacteriaceae bacterium]|nr:hypothetical protein [Symbiobacteriaceae bacterium]